MQVDDDNDDASRTNGRGVQTNETSWTTADGSPGDAPRREREDEPDEGSSGSDAGPGSSTTATSPTAPASSAGGLDWMDQSLKSSLRRQVLTTTVPPGAVRCRRRSDTTTATTTAIGTATTGTAAATSSSPRHRPGAYSCASSTSCPSRSPPARTSLLLQAKAEIGGTAAGAADNDHGDGLDDDDDDDDDDESFVSLQRDYGLKESTTANLKKAQQNLPTFRNNGHNIHSDSLTYPDAKTKTTTGDELLHQGHHHLPVAMTVDTDEDNNEPWLPAAIEYDVEAKPSVAASHRARYGRPLLYFVALFLLCTSIGVTFTVTSARRKRRHNVPLLAPRELLGIREYVAVFLGSDHHHQQQQLDDDDDDDDDSTARRAYDYEQQALHWIIHEDPQLLDLNAGTLLQRYVLAVFHYANLPVEKGEGETLLSIQDNSFPWLSNESECHWQGVRCDALGQVRSIDLYDPRDGSDKDGKSVLRRIGTIPSVLWRLPFLQRLSLPFGNLQDDVFPLAMMDESSNRTSWRSTAPRHLTTLNLRGNQIRADLGDDDGSVAAALQAMRSLRYVDLGENQLVGTLQSTSLFATPQDVLVLLLDDNQLSGGVFRANHFVNFTNLRRCGIDRNQFDGPLFRSWNDFPRVAELTMNDNRFTGPFPRDMPFHLQALAAHNNALTGPWPASLVTSSPHLEHLDLANNKLDGTLPPVADLLAAASLRHLDLHGNALTGTIIRNDNGENVPPNNTLSAAAPSFSALEYFDITFNQIHGGSLQPLCQGIRVADVVRVVRADCLAVVMDENHPNTTMTSIDCPCCTTCCHAASGECVDDDDNNVVHR